ncbi:MAG: pentapeptide repeat-containing protein [Rhodoplanes sp.]
MADKVDPFDVEALETSLNDSATRVSALWISFLIFGLYLVIAAGTVTHRQLLLEDPIKLPVLNIELPLVGFFFLAPILFVIFHAYVQLQVLLLGRTAAAYNEAVEENFKVAADNARVRQRLANTLFAQIFAGSPRERDGWLGVLLKAMAWITLAIAPVLILLFFQFQFLPYHSGAVTWAVRFLIVVDLAIILVLWPAARDPGHEVTLRGVFRQWVALPIAIATAAFAWIALSFPGEPHAEWTRYWPDKDSRSTAHRFGNGLQCRTRSPISAVYDNFDRLYLPRVDAVDDEKLKKIEDHTKAAGEPDYQGERTQHLRERDFNCAVFSDYADLRRVDLTGASLRGTLFDRSKLQGASLVGAQLQGASLNQTQLQGASLDGAELQGASLNAAQLQGTNLNSSALTKTVLWYAAVWLARNADCGGARVQNARLDEVIQFDVVEPTKSVRATPAAIAKFIDDSVAGIPGTKIKQQAINRMRAGLIVDPAKDDTAEIAKVWHKCEEESTKVSQAEFDKKHAAFLRDLVCNAEESRQAIAKGIIRNWTAGAESLFLPNQENRDAVRPNFNSFAVSSPAPSA